MRYKYYISTPPLGDLRKLRMATVKLEKGWIITEI